MSTLPRFHDDRRRADSFGAVAAEYDRHRPRYPRPLIADLVTSPGMLVADVGAGTGIASSQFIDAGARVLAIEPDARMARVAVDKTDKGIVVEQATFEEWQPAGRTFDLVVFASSFHWVDPRRAMQKIPTILRPGGRLALLANRITPTAPTEQDFEDINADYLDMAAQKAFNMEDEVVATLEEQGFTVERRGYVEPLHYSTEGYLDLVFTYSNRVTLEANARAELRSRLAERIGPKGVDAENDARAIVCTRSTGPTLD